MDDADKPTLRRTLRAHLAERPSVALSTGTLHRRFEKEFDCTAGDVADALKFLLSLGQVKEIQDPMGGRELSYQATAAGILAHERGE